MGFDTKPNFNSQKFEQCQGDIMNLSGCTQIFSALDMESGSTLSVCDGATLNISTDAGIDKVLRSSASGDGTWIELPVSDAKNALTVTDGTVLFGGELIQETDVELNSNILSFNNQNPPFDIGTGFDGYVAQVSEEDNKYTISGAFHNFSGVTAEGLIRLNTDGSIDPTLEIGTGFWKTGGSTAVSTHIVQTDGKILVGGSFTQYSGASYSNLIRLNSDGTVDTGFNPPESSLAGVRVIYVKDDGKIIVGGDFTNHLIQLNTDGTTDTGFTVGTGFAGGETVAWTFVLDIAEQPDGQLLIAGDYNSYSGITAGHMIRLNPDGSYDDTFDTNPGFDRRVRTIALQSDGSMVLGGEFVEYNDGTLHSSKGIARLNSDATYDDTFDVGLGFTGNTGTEPYHIGAKNILKQVNNQFLVTGFFTWYNGTPVSGVTRLNNDGTIDTTFDSGTGFDAVPADAIVTSNGKFLLGGNFTEYSGASWNGLIRLSYYGAIDDQSLDSMVKFNGQVVEYGGNYESYYTNRSLVDKEYVDNHVSTGTTSVTGEHVTKEVTQATHGFAVQDFIGWSGGTYNKAIADGTYDGEFVGLVTAVPDVDTFCVTQSGFITGLTVSSNSTYFLSPDTAGLITTTEPSVEGEISKTVLIANSATSGWVLPYVGYYVTTGTTGVSTANNGLSVDAGIVQLGGDLIKNTTIDTCGNDITISNLPAQTIEDNIMFLDSGGTLSCGPIPAGGGDYTLTSPATCTVGGVSPGYVMTGKTLECIIRDAFAPYIEPTFSSFTVNTIGSPIEVGTVVSGNHTFNWGTTCPTNITSNTIGIINVNSGTTLGSGLTNDGAESLSVGTLDNSEQILWRFRISGCSTQDNPFTRDVTKCVLHPYFWGTETGASRPTVDNTLVNSGTKVVNYSTGPVTVTFAGSDEWTWLAIPDTSTQKVCWYQDDLSNGTMLVGGSRYPDEQAVVVTDAGGCWSGVDYKVYMSDVKTTDTVAVQFRNS